MNLNYCIFVRSTSNDIYEPLHHFFSMHKLSSAYFFGIVCVCGFLFERTGCGKGVVIQKITDLMTLEFSSDTILFDTVFTTIGSVTLTSQGFQPKWKML